MFMASFNPAVQQALAQSAAMGTVPAQNPTPAQPGDEVRGPGGFQQTLERTPEAAPASNAVSALERAQAPFSKMNQVVQRTHELVRRMGETPTADQHRLMPELIGLQMEAQQAAFQAEMVSKVVEHSTTSTRTVLQTQA